jgi:hypothetical protein
MVVWCGGRWKKLVGFVPQEDVMIRQLTVRDNIAFSADYRLPVEMTAAEKNQIVNETLLSLGIDHVQHSVIGASTQLPPLSLLYMHRSLCICLPLLIASAVI